MKLACLCIIHFGGEVNKPFGLSLKSVVATAFVPPDTYLSFNANEPKTSIASITLGSLNGISFETHIS